MLTRKKKVVLLAVVFAVSICCAFIVDNIAFHYSHYDTETDENVIFTDGHEAYSIIDCGIIENKIVFLGPDPQFTVSTGNRPVSEVHILFGEPLRMLTPLQIYYVRPGASFSEEQSKKAEIVSGATDVRITIPKANYSELRFDFGDEVTLEKIYSGNEKRIYSYPYQPHAGRLYLLFLEIFAGLLGVVLAFLRQRLEGLN